MASYASVVWTTGDILTETKLDNMVSNDQSEDAHAANGMIMNNGVWYKGKNAGGTPQNLMRMNSSDKIEIGKGEMAWERLGETTLGSPADVITMSSLATRQFLKILVSVENTGGTIGIILTLNNDTGTNYARADSVNGAVDTTATEATGIQLSPNISSVPKFSVVDIKNIATKEKLIINNAVSQGTAGSTTAPDRREGISKWANTSNAVTRIDITNTGTGSYATGSKVIVLGHD